MMWDLLEFGSLITQSVGDFKDKPLNNQATSAWECHSIKQRRWTMSRFWKKNHEHSIRCGESKWKCLTLGLGFMRDEDWQCGFKSPQYKVTIEPRESKMISWRGKSEEYDCIIIK
jgi:hypothetical protein